MTVTIAGQPVHVIQKRDLIAMLEPFRDDACVCVEVQLSGAIGSEFTDKLVEGAGIIEDYLKETNSELDTEARRELRSWAADAEADAEAACGTGDDCVTGYFTTAPEKQSDGMLVLKAFAE